MPAAHSTTGEQGLDLKAYPGAGSVLLAFDLPESLKEDLAGPAIQVTAPEDEPRWLLNRLTFTDPITASTTPTERRQIATTTDNAPLQRFHWTHFPPQLVASRS